MNKDLLVKKENNLRIRQIILPSIIAVIQWLDFWLFGVDLLFFSRYSFSKILLLEKVLFLIFLILVWNCLFYFIREYRKKNPVIRRGIKLFVIYFLILLTLCILLWPGTWSWDDIFSLERLVDYSYHPWQHVFTGMIQMIFLQLFPSAGGLIVVQNAIISCCVSYIIVSFEESVLGEHLINWKYTFLELIPFLLPPVLMYQLSGYRIGLYVYAEAVWLSFSSLNAMKNGVGLV